MGYGVLRPSREFNKAFFDAWKKKKRSGAVQTDDAIQIERQAFAHGQADVFYERHR